VEDGNRKLREFCEAHLLFITAQEDSKEEEAARVNRDRLLTLFSQNDFAHAIAVAIGIKNVLIRAREQLTTNIASAA